MKKIAIEEHFTTLTYQAYVQRLVAEGSFSSLVKNPQPIDAQLLDLGESRLRAMDEAGIEMQVLSLRTPGLERVPASDAIALAQDINDELAAHVCQNPRRFAGFAALPTTQPQAAADELERAVSKLGFKGAIIHGQPEDTFLDDQRYWELFAVAEALGVPLFLHPTAPAPGMLQAYQGCPELVGSLWSFTVDCATQLLRLIVSGVFDRYPNLTVILGHLGETLPYLLWRLDSRWKSSTFDRHLSRLPSQYLQENVWVATSGMLYAPALLCACMTLGADRVLFAVDYPFEGNRASAEFIEHAPISETDKRKICSLNAEQWLRF